MSTPTEAKVAEFRELTARLMAGMRHDNRAMSFIERDDLREKIIGLYAAEVHARSALQARMLEAGFREDGSALPSVNAHARDDDLRQREFSWRLLTIQGDIAEIKGRLDTRMIIDVIFSIAAVVIGAVLIWILRSLG